MSEILQGTTPGLKIKIDTKDFLVSDVIKVEFKAWNDGDLSNQGFSCSKELTDMTVDPEDNSFSYTFTEKETLAMTPNKQLRYQLRFMFADGSIVGTRKMAINVTDLYSKDVMSE